MDPALSLVKQKSPGHWVAIASASPRNVLERFFARPFESGRLYHVGRLRPDGVVYRAPFPTMWVGVRSGALQPEARGFCRLVAEHPRLDDLIREPDPGRDDRDRILDGDAWDRRVHQGADEGERLRLLALLEVEPAGARHGQVSAGRVRDHHVPPEAQELEDVALEVERRVTVGRLEVRAPRVVPAPAEGVPDGRRELARDEDPHVHRLRVTRAGGVGRRRRSASSASRRFRSQKVNAAAIERFRASVSDQLTSGPSARTRRTCKGRSSSRAPRGRASPRRRCGRRPSPDARSRR